MLIEFSVENFRSIRERQTFSMVAAPRIKKLANLVKTTMADGVELALLKVAAIYGPNASGKSNLIRALSVIPIVLKFGLDDPQRKLKIEPFKFDTALADQPSRFTMHFIANGIRYCYELAVDCQTIQLERLTLYKKTRGITLFERTLSGYDTTGLEGSEATKQVWIDTTSATRSFLATAVANQSDAFTQLKPAFKWLTSSVIQIGGFDNMIAETRQRLASLEPEVLSDLAKEVSRLDIPIIEVKVQGHDDWREKLNDHVKSRPDSPKQAEKFFEEFERLRHPTTKLVHHTSLSTQEFDFEDESAGTQKLIAFLYHWLGFRNKKLPANFWAVDELDSSLHPEIIVELMRQINSSDITHQLIFSTHSTHLMATETLRRDQLWLLERDLMGASQLRSIHDFEGREGEEVEKRYYEGRYRALPFFPRARHRESTKDTNP